MKVEFGSGYAPTPGFVHVDANPSLALRVARRVDEPCRLRDPHVDVRADASAPLPWPDDHFEEIRAVDVLEHISYRRTRAVLTEWARVLAPGGRLYVQVPDFGRVADWLDEQANLEAIEQRARDLHRAGVTPDDHWLTAVNAILMGGHDDGHYVRDDDDWRWNAHYALFTEARLTEELRDAGLEVESCVTNRHPNLMCWAVKL